MAILRTAIFQPEARDATPAARIERLAALLAEAGRDPFDLVLCPELFLSGYDIGARLGELAEPAGGPSLKHAARIAARHGTALAPGYPQRDAQALYNAVAVIGRSGERLLDYRKRALAPGFEGGTFAPGDAPGVFDLMGHRMAVLVCFDVELPELAREAAMAGAEVLLVPTALHARWGFVARKMIPTRAFENGTFLLYANHAGREGRTAYLGESVIVAPDGAELARAGAEETLISADLEMDAVALARAALPYLEICDRLYADGRLRVP